MSNVSAAKVETALDREMSFVLDLLCDELAEDDLLGEVLTADNDTGGMGTGGERQQYGEEDDNFKDHALSHQETVRQGRGTRFSEISFSGCHSEPLPAVRNLLF